MVWNSRTVVGRKFNSKKTRNAKRMLGIAAAAGAALSLFGGSARANTADSVTNGQADLTASGSYAGGSPGTTGDVDFANITYSPTAFTLNTNAFNLSIGTLDDLDATQTLTIQNTTSGSTSTITLNGGTNSVSGTAGDLLYVASGGTLNLQTGGSGTLNLALGAAGNLDIAGTETIGSVISGINGLTKTGAGTLTLSGAESYTSTTTVNAGTLTLGSGSSLTSTALAFGTSSIGSSGTFTDTETSGAAQNFSSNTTINGGFSTINNTVSGDTLTLGTVTRPSGNGMVDFGTLTGNINTSTTNTSGIVGPWAYFGSGTTLDYAVAGTSGATITALGAATALPAGGPGVSATNYTLATGQTQTANTVGNTLRYTGGANTLALGTTSLGLNGLMNAGTGLLTVTGTAANPGLVATGELDIASNTQGISISSVISGSGTVVYGGPSAGTFTISGANTYTQGTVLNSGVLAIGSAGALGATTTSAGALTINGGTINEGFAGTLNNIQQNWNGSFAVTGSNALNMGTGAITLGTGANPVITSTATATLTEGGAITGNSNLTINSNGSGATAGGNITFAGNINNAGSITNSGNYSNVSSGATAAGGGVILAGNIGGNVTSILENPTVGTAAGATGSSLTLSGTNTSYDGTTTVEQGTLVISTATALGGNGSTSGTGGSLILNGGAGLNAFSSLTISTVNAESWNGTLNFTGGNLNLGTGTITLNGSNVSILNQGNGVAITLTIGGTITGSSSLSKVDLYNTQLNAGAGGLGALILNGALNYTGGTNIQQGQVVIGASSALPTTGTVLLADLAPNSVGWQAAGLVTDYALSSTDLSKISSSSVGVVALGANSSSNLNFNSGGSNGGGLSNVSLGGNTTNGYNYSGTLTPFNQTYQLGGSASTTAGTLNVTSSLPNVNSTVTNLIVDPNLAGANAGVVTLALNQNGYTGTTTVNNGTLKLDFGFSGNNATTSNIINSSSALLLGGGATLDVSGATNTTADSQTFNGATLLGGNSTLMEVNGSGGTGTVTTTLGAITRSNDASLNLSTTPSATFVVNASNAADAGGLLGEWATAGTGAGTAYAATNGTTITAAAGTTTGQPANLSDVTSATTNYNFGATATPTQTANLVANTLRYTGTGAGAVSNGGFTDNLNGLMNAGTGLLTIQGAGNVSSGSTNNELVLDTANNSITITSNIVNNGANATALTITGANVVTLSPTTANTFTGGTTLDQGTLAINNTSSATSNLGTGTLTMSGGTLEFGTAAVNISNSILVTAGTANTIYAGTNSSTDTLSGSITGSGTLTFGIVQSNSTTDTLTGNLSGFTGTLIYNGNQNNGNALTFTGTTAGSLDLAAATLVQENLGTHRMGLLAGGILQVGAIAGAAETVNAGTLQVGALNTNSSWSGDLITSNANLTKVGTGTLTWNTTSNPENLNSNIGTTVNNGTLLIDLTNNTTGVGYTNSTLVLNGGTLGVLGKDTSLQNTSQAFSGTTIGTSSGQGGYGTVSVNNNGGNGTLLTLAGITRNSGAGVNFVNPSGTLGSTNGITTTTANNSAGILGGYATVNGTNFAVSGGSTVPISALTTYNATNSTGETATTHNDVETAGVTLGSALTINSLTISDTGNNALAMGANNVTFTGTAGGLLYAGNGSGGGSYSITGTGVIGSGSANEFIVNVNSGANLTIGAPIIATSGATNGFLSVLGAGTLTLTSTTPSTYTFGNFIAGGTLVITNDAELGAGGGGQLLNINGGTLELASNYTPSGTLFSTQATAGNGIKLGQSGGTINTNGNSVAYAGVISSPLAVMTGTTANTEDQFGFTKAGTGTLTLTNSGQTYAGATTVTNGVLSVADFGVNETTAGGVASGLGESANYARNLILNGGTLQYNSSGSGETTDRLFSLGVNGGTIDASGSGALNMSNTGAVAYTIGSNDASTNSSPTLTLTGTNSGANTLAASIGNNGIGTTSLTKSGAGNWVLTNANTYSGATTINTGVLRANNTTGSATGSGNITAVAGSSNYGGGTLGGSGTVSGTVTLAASSTAKQGGIIAAGPNSTTTGTLTTGSETWNNGSAYQWKIAAPGTGGQTVGSGGSGTTGTTSTWDDVVMSALNLSSAGGSNSPITIALTNTATLSSANGEYSWIIAQTSTAPTLPAGVLIGTSNNLLTEQVSGGSAMFALDTSTNNFTMNGVSAPSSSLFSLELVSNGGSGDNLVLDYDATPEPGTAVLVLAGGLPMLSARRRRKRINNAD